MRKVLLPIMIAVTFFQTAYAQDYNQLTDDGIYTPSGFDRTNKGRSDSIQSQHKEIPKGLKVWTVDERFGDIRSTTPDTLSHMFMNTIFTTGLHGEYNTLGNVGSPRINRIFIDRSDFGDFIFSNPYDFFGFKPEEFHFTNTLSPITNLSYNSAGDRTNGEDHFKALFAVNAGKRLGVGFKFDYIYGRGYYSNQSTSHFNYSFYGSYLGDRYQAHFLAGLNYQKVAENGGITNDEYITAPESFNESFTEEEIPTVLSRNWNRNDSKSVFFNHRYSFGFMRKVPMTPEEIEARKFAIKAKKEQEAREAKERARRLAEKNNEDFDEEEYDKQMRSAGRPDDAVVQGDSPLVGVTADEGRIVVNGKAEADSLIAISESANNDTTWLKDEYVPVTSIIHTLNFENLRRIYQAYDTPDGFYLNDFGEVGKFLGDSIFDKTRHWHLKNTVGIALLEGFNKWAKAGVKIYGTNSLRHFTLPNTERGYNGYTENSYYVGGQLTKAQGRTLHYVATGEIGVAGDEAGEINVSANADLNFPLFGDSVRLEANGMFHKYKPFFYYEKFQSKHFAWQNDNLDDIVHSRVEGVLNFGLTRTSLRLAVDQISNYTYLAQTYNLVQSGNDMIPVSTDVSVRQASSLNILTVQLKQDFTFGKINWENEITYQHSSDEDAVAVPDINIYSNLYLRFKIAKVLKCDFGADLRYFTKYFAPEYCPGVGQFVVQENKDVRVKTGNYPIVNLYANFHLKHTRFFVMMSHVNYSEGGEAFLTPHYPINQRIFRFGLSWNFFN